MSSKKDSKIATTRGVCGISTFIPPEKLVEILTQVPTPRIYAMDFRAFCLVESDIIPNNTIIISKDLAGILQLETLKDKDGNKNRMDGKT